MHEELHDESIVQSVLNGEKSSYAILVERYSNYVFTIISRLVANREEAEDIAQEVFVKAYLSLAGFRGKSKFSTWLYSIAHTTGISHLRRRTVDRIFAEEDQIAAYADNKTHETSEQSVNHKTMQQIVEYAISKLDIIDAEIITLFYMAGQTVEEVAAITSMETGTVKVRLFRARQKMKDIIEQKYGAEVKYFYTN